MDEVIHELALAVAAVIELQVTLAMLVAILPLTIIIFLMVVHFYPFSFLPVFFKATLVNTA